MKVSITTVRHEVKESYENQRNSYTRRTERRRVVYDSRITTTRTFFSGMDFRRHGSFGPAMRRPQDSSLIFTYDSGADRGQPIAGLQPTADRIAAGQQAIADAAGVPVDDPQLPWLESLVRAGLPREVRAAADIHRALGIKPTPEQLKVWSKEIFSFRVRHQERPDFLTRHAPADAASYTLPPDHQLVDELWPALLDAPAIAGHQEGWTKAHFQSRLTQMRGSGLDDASIHVWLSAELEVAIEQAQRRQDYLEQVALPVGTALTFTGDGLDKRRNYFNERTRDKPLPDQERRLEILEDLGDGRWKVKIDDDDIEVLSLRSNGNLAAGGISITPPDDDGMRQVTFLRRWTDRAADETVLQYFMPTTDELTV